MSNKYYFVCLCSISLIPPAPHMDCRIVKTSGVLESNSGETIKVTKAFVELGGVTKKK